MSRDKFEKNIFITIGMIDFSNVQFFDDARLVDVKQEDFKQFVLNSGRDYIIGKDSRGEFYADSDGNELFGNIRFDSATNNFEKNNSDAFEVILNGKTMLLSKKGIFKIITSFDENSDEYLDNYEENKRLVKCIQDRTFTSFIKTHFLDLGML